jgi:lipopolysaccharide/colanic/teichoic acid biosynthesis glycosyltransferase
MLTDVETRPMLETISPAAAASPARTPRRAARDERLLLPMPAPSWAGRLYQPLRRLADFSLALLLSAAAAPFIGAIALIVRLSSRGPAFYTQVRTGRAGQPFTIYKLRTMVDNCESLTGPRWTIPGDPRITPLGWFLRHTHLDELPQLYNVLRGDMSLIGPRPERPEFVQELERRIPGYQRRHMALPGITGLAQVQLPPDTDVDSVRRKVLYDLYFIRHTSPLLDACILLCTALHMLGLPCNLVQKLRLVPGPERVEAPAFPRALAPNPRLRNQAA